MDNQAKMQPTNPYLTVRGAAEAIAFYQKAFDAKENTRMPAQDGKRLMPAELSFTGGIVMLTDQFPEHADHGAIRAPTADQPASVAVVIHFDTPAEVDAIFRRAVNAGCKATLEPQDMFWGARFAMLNDPFGHRWMLNAPLPKK